MTRALALACLCAVLSACSDPPGDSGSAGNYQRVVTLAPGLTELVFEIGAGDILIGVSAWSDYPREVLDLPVVGDAFSVDHEALAMLRRAVAAGGDPDVLSALIDDLDDDG